MLENLTTTALFLISALFLIGFSAFGFISIKEKEKRAARISFIIAMPGAALFFFFALLPLTFKIALLMLIAFAALAFIVMFFIPIGKIVRGQDTPVERIDERDIMFARSMLVPGSAEYEAYYQMRPENLEKDNQFREKPGLLGKGSLFHDPILGSSVDASFYLTEAMNKAVDGPIYPEKQDLSPEEATLYIKNLAKYYGALHVGITELKPYHVYSHIGRGDGTYGAELPVDHRYAIAFSVEMNHDMIGPNPLMMGSMESAKEYVDVGRVAIQLAAAIRFMGFPARGHMDGNYRVVCPLVARDAGLGEIGRMGLLMTKSHGPRVRLAVVTTDLDLIPDPYIQDDSILDFCTICKKCSTNCPSQSISFEDREIISGTLRWQINSDTCYKYWCTAGTDCGRCMTVCPYAHPSNIMHDMIRLGIQYSGFFRRLVNWADDFFYGKKPRPRDPLLWIKSLKSH
ncbi:MAG: 4Fe-4S dicluster domain-containing protein [Anaerolineaceae bacterium]|nr:4Fe-4S dicluster domain-containing protein [Anaerolineaceae bacterium]